MASAEELHHINVDETLSILKAGGVGEVLRQKSATKYGDHPGPR
jgi:hypothetical protein